MRSDKAEQGGEKHRGLLRTTAAHYRNSSEVHHRLSQGHWPHLLGDLAELHHPEKLFGNGQPCVLDIGFGKGEALCEAARTNPGLNFLGVELFAPGVLWLCRQAVQLPLDNLRLAFEDARTVLQQLPPASLAGVQLLFPDPWPKRRQNKRRLIQPEFCDLLHAAMKPGGTLLIATDWADYALWIADCFAAAAGWQQLNVDGSADRGIIPPRPQTRFEVRAAVAGRQTAELWFRAEKRQ